MIQNYKRGVSIYLIKLNLKKNVTAKSPTEYVVQDDSYVNLFQ